MLHCLCQVDDGPGDPSEFCVRPTRSGVFNESANSLLSPCDWRYILALLEVAIWIEYGFAQPLEHRDTVVPHVAGFSIDNPNAQRGCGCGQSFS